MNILPLQLAYKSLFVHKGRTILTLLGIVIGISAVIIVLGAGESIKGLVLKELESFGSDYIQIEIKVPSKGRNSVSSATSLVQGVEVTTLTKDDAQAISELENIKTFYAAIMGQSSVSYLDKSDTLNFIGTTAGFIDIDVSEIKEGRFYTAEEDANLAKLVVLGSDVASNLFGNQDSVGQSLRVGKNKFKVIGVLKERGGGFGLNFDEMIYLPLETAQKIIMGVNHVSWITAQLYNTDIQELTADEIEFLLRQRHDIDSQDSAQWDFSVITMAEAMELIDVIFGGIALLLTAIAGVSLIVGGVGIMNIMYVSVVERTFEIGLRKSVGATFSQIKWQFIFEAVFLTVVGGIIGIVFGVLFTLIISIIATYLGYFWPFRLPPESILLAFGFSTLIGLFFGYYPAKQAAKMNPISAMRRE